MLGESTSGPGLTVRAFCIEKRWEFQDKIPDLISNSAVVLNCFLRRRGLLSEPRWVIKRVVDDT